MINKVLNLHFNALYIKEIISPVLVSLFVNKIFWAIGKDSVNFKNIFNINSSILHL